MCEKSQDKEKDLFVKSESKSIDIIYTTDIHGDISPVKDKKNPGNLAGGLSHIGSLVKELKENSQGNNILLDAGDWALGTYESRLTVTNPPQAAGFVTPAVRRVLRDLSHWF